MKPLLIILALAFAAAAQTLHPSISVGTDAPSASACDRQTVGNVYVRSENASNGPINVQRCTQTGALAYAWHPIDHLVVATLPSRCAVGDVAFRTGVSAGSNLYGCTSTDTWSAQAGGGSGAPAVGDITGFGAAGNVIRSTGSAYADSAISSSDVGLGSVTNNAQTKASIVPNTVPSAGQILAGNAGGTAYTPVTMSGACTMTSAGVMSCSGGGASFTYHSYTYTSGTLTVDFSSFATATVTASGADPTLAFTAPADGRPLFLLLCNDGAARTWTGVIAGVGVPAVASACVGTSLRYNGATYDTTGSTETASILRGTERAASGVATPAATQFALISDSSRGTMWHQSNNSSNVHIMPRTASSTDQMASTDLSDTANIGKLATASTWSTKQTFTPSGTASGVNLGGLSGSSDPSVPVNGDIYYSIGLAKLRCYENSAWKDCILSGAGSGTVTATGGALTANAVMVGAGSADSKVLAALGASGTVLTSNGAGVPPSFQAVAGTGTVTTTGSPANGNLAKFSGASSVTNTDLTGDVTTSGGVAATIAANVVTSAKMAAVNTRRTACLTAGAKNAASALADTDLADSDAFFIPAAATVVEVTVHGDAGTPNVIVGRDRAGSVVNLTSSALATASAGAIACSNTGGTTGLDAATTCSATLQNTGLNAGDWLKMVSGTAGGTAKQMSACVTWTVN